MDLLDENIPESHAAYNEQGMAKLGVVLGAVIMAAYFVILFALKI